ncbi:MAG: histidine kinase [Bacteroidetes bacterium]|nr:histidine kinase [Bacteroidota bacterium]
MLKAQVHPHFLFNTLNNIYSFAMSAPPFAARLVDNLSGTMHYMTAECEAPAVPLDKELRLIRDYIELEKVRYGDRLHTDIMVDGNSGGKLIDPLLMIPLVENCFKHGASLLLEGSWIKLHIFIESAVLKVEVRNNKPLHTPYTNRQGIGLNNVRKRLRLLHPENHSLEIHSAPEEFTVFLQVPLKQQH